MQKCKNVVPIYCKSRWSSLSGGLNSGLSSELSICVRASLRSAYLGCMLLLACFLVQPGMAVASQKYEPMSDQVLLALRSSLGDNKPRVPLFQSAVHRVDWLAQMSTRLARRIPNFQERVELIKLIRYEAQRAGLDPQLVFALIEIESNFRADAISPAGAIGLMQVMPFWTDVLSNGSSRQLFDPRLNVRYGCLILRHYLDIERGNVERALARYNGSLGKPTYPNLVYDRLDRNWGYRFAGPVELVSKGN